MKNLKRALRTALTYRWSIIGSITCSVLVALLWGANMGAVYPFVEIVLKNKTLTEWAEERIDESNATIAKAEKTIEQIEARFENGGVANDNRAKLEREIRSKQTDITTHRERIDSTNNLMPWLRRFAPEDPFQTLVMLVTLMVVGTLFRGIFLTCNMYLVARVGQRTVLDLQNKVFDNVVQMETSEVGVKGTGDLISRIRGETGAIGTAISTLLGKTIREPLKMSVCLGGAALVNWRLLLFSILICPIGVYLMMLLAKSTKRATKQAMEESAKLLNRLYQAITYLRVVKAFNMERDEQHRFQVVAQDVYKRAMRISLYNALARSNNELIGVGMISLSILAGGFLVLNSQTHLFGIRMSPAVMEFGDLMLFFAFLIGIADPLRKMGDVYNSIQGGVVAADRVYPLMDQIPAVQSPAAPVAVPNGPLNVEFDNVQFSYDAESEILKGVSFEIPEGTTLAIIGPNGCGKSTLINLLPRFFDVGSGAIRVGGNDIRDYEPGELRSHIGYVTQLTMLFGDSIEANISYGNSDATTKDIVHAAKKSHADEFIRNLVDGYETDIGEHGGKLSGGQRQRLALARVILHDPKILILDEATSQIDPESEILIHETLKEFTQNRTTLIVTHRMSTLELADRILVMNEGQVVDCGTHQELLARCSTYRRLRATEMEDAA